MEAINFTKMHGCGNDYVYINCMEREITAVPALARAVSPRRSGIGSDGVILICPSSVADAKMRIFNADGSEGKMCGNGIRCVGKYLYDNNICRKTKLSVETLSGIKELWLDIGKGGYCENVTVAMGRADFSPKAVPVRAEKELIQAEVKISENIYELTVLSMGNPHAVMFVSDPLIYSVEKVGPLIEKNVLFPEGVNTEFVSIKGKNRLRMRVWERGSGETAACGTGACAAAAAAVKNGFCNKEEPITVELNGGTLTITVGDDYSVVMKGEAVKVYEGVYEYDPS